MNNIIFKSTNIKIISILLCMLLVWQGAVWANPNITSHNNISPQSFFELSMIGDSTIRYLLNDLAAVERGPGNRKLSHMQGVLASRISELISSNDNYKDVLPDPEEILMQNTVLSGEVYVDIGDFRLRYVSPKIGSLDCPAGYTAKKDIPECLVGGYLHRQIVLRDTISDEKKKRERAKDPTPIEKDFVLQTRLGQYFGDEAVDIIKEVLGGLMPKDANVLDLMSGAHTYMPDVSGEVVGVGLNPIELSKNPHLTTWIVQDINERPKLDKLEDGKFDAVMMTNGMAYLEEPQKNFEDAARTLKPGGVLFVAFSSYCWPSSARKEWHDMEVRAVENIAQIRGISHGGNYQQQVMLEAGRIRAEFTMRTIFNTGEFKDIKIEMPGTMVTEGQWLQPLIMITAVKADPPRADPVVRKDIEGTLFDVEGKRFYAQKVTDTKDMRDTLDVWFAQRDEDIYFSRSNWKHIIEFDIEHNGRKGYMVKLQAENGELLGISIMTKGDFPFENGERKVWQPQYFEISRSARGLGVGGVMLAKILENVLEDVESDHTFKIPGEDDEFTVEPEKDVLENIMIVHPAEEKEAADQDIKTAKAFYLKAGFRRLPILWTAWAEEEDRLKDVYLGISSVRADTLIEQAHKYVVEPKRAPYTADLYEDNDTATIRAAEAISEKLKNDKIVDRLTQALMNLAGGERGDKKVLALDMDLTDGDVENLFKRLAEKLPRNNEELKIFLRDLEIVGGKGEKLAERIKRISTISGEGSNKVRPENIIILAESGNSEYFAAFTEATVAEINMSEFSEDGYMPLLEIMLFTIGKHLGWSGEELKIFYKFIPNVLFEEELSEKEALELFTKDIRKFSVRLIRNAVPLDNSQRVEIMDALHTMLARA